ncbi:MAG: hypothetical protein ACTSW7_01420 [Candidatus Thorarchaeota archaeon]|nr:hypothetical protein [Thermoplasmatales archaeon]
MSDDLSVGKGMGRVLKKDITIKEKEITSTTESFIRQITNNKNRLEQIASIKYALRLIFKTLDILCGR